MTIARPGFPSISGAGLPPAFSPILHLFTLLCYMGIRLWNPLRADLRAAGIPVLPSSLVRRHMRAELRKLRPHYIGCAAKITMWLFNPCLVLLFIAGIIFLFVTADAESSAFQMIGWLMLAPTTLCTLAALLVTVYANVCTTKGMGLMAGWAYTPLSRGNSEHMKEIPSHVTDRMALVVRIPGTTFVRAWFNKDPIIFARRKHGFRTLYVPIGAYDTGNPLLDAW